MHTKGTQPQSGEADVLLDAQPAAQPHAQRDVQPSTAPLDEQPARQHVVDEGKEKRSSVHTKRTAKGPKVGKYP